MELLSLRFLRLMRQALSMSLAGLSPSLMIIPLWKPVPSLRLRKVVRPSTSGMMNMVTFRHGSPS